MRAETRAAEAAIMGRRFTVPVVLGSVAGIEFSEASAALYRIREILDRPPQAYDTQKIQAEIAGVLGPYTYRPWPRLKP